MCALHSILRSNLWGDELHRIVSSQISVKILFLGVLTPTKHNNSWNYNLRKRVNPYSGYKQIMHLLFKGKVLI